MGLGNPGPRYAGTRHNVGFEVARAFTRRHGLAVGSRLDAELACGPAAGHEVGVLLPQTFMNASGVAVAAALRAFPEVAPDSGLLIVYDDLDLPLGRIRLRARGAAGGHRGMASVIEAVGADRVARLRFGVGRPPPGEDPRSYVLDPFDEAERAGLAGRIAHAVDAIDHFLAHGIASAMDRFNAAPPEPPAA